MNSLTAFSQPLLRWGGDPSGGAPYVYADPANPQSYTGFEPTGDRAREILFSKPYYLFRLQLTVKKTDNQINSLEECRKYNKSVGTLVNCAAYRLLEEGGYKVKGYQDVELGRIDAVLIDVAEELFYARHNPKLKAAGKPFQTGAYVVGIRNQDTLKQP